MDFIKKLSEMDLWYLPIVILFGLMLFGFLVGLWRGWKLALYYLVFNIVGFIATILILDGIYESQLKSLANKLPSDIANQIGTEALDKTLSLFKGWIILMLALVVLAVINLIAWLVHFFFRKRLKLQKATKGHSNANSRLFGGVFGIITAFPGTLGLVGASSIFVNNKNVSDFIDAATNVATLGKSSTISEDWDAIYSLVLSAKHAETLAQIFSGTKVDDDTKITNLINDKKIIVAMLNNGKSSTVIDSIVSHLQDNGALGTLSDAGVADIKSSHPELSGLLSGTTDFGKQKAIAIIDNFKDTNLSPSQYEDFLTFLGLMQ